ncbi:uncharacterized protein DS421_7g211540 [Arachis hypogaea]|nr:uncharacterized protein DS421_7g211540 [Arachis hypogaea]
MNNHYKKKNTIPAPPPASKSRNTIFPQFPHQSSFYPFLFCISHQSATKFRNNPHSLLSAYGCAAVIPFARAAVAFYCCRATVAPLARAACRSVAVAPPSLLLSIAAMAPPTLVLLRSLSIELTRIMYRFQSHLQFQLEIPYFSMLQMKESDWKNCGKR